MGHISSTFLSFDKMTNWRNVAEPNFLLKCFNHAIKTFCLCFSAPPSFKQFLQKNLDFFRRISYTHDIKLHYSNICYCIYARYSIAYICSKIFYCIYVRYAIAYMKDMLLHIWNICYCIYERNAIPYIKDMQLFLWKICFCIYARYAIARMQDTLLHICKIHYMLVHIWMKCNCRISIHAIAYIQNAH